MFGTLPPPPMSADEARAAYATFLGDIPRFDAALARVLAEWPVSCEQFLSNTSLNRIAWLGQSSACIDMGVPAAFRSGFKLLSADAQTAANDKAEEWLRKWERRYA